MDYEPDEIDTFEERLEEISRELVELQEFRWVTREDATAIENLMCDIHLRLEPLDSCECENNEADPGLHEDPECPMNLTDAQIIRDLREHAAEESVPQRIRDLIEDAALFAAPTD